MQRQHLCSTCSASTEIVPVRPCPIYATLPFRTLGYSFFIQSHFHRSAQTQARTSLSRNTHRRSYSGKHLESFQAGTGRQWKTCQQMSPLSTLFWLVSAPYSLLLLANSALSSPRHRHSGHFTLSLGLVLRLPSHPYLHSSICRHRHSSWTWIAFGWYSICWHPFL